MRIGCCSGLDQVHIAHAAGFDYVECTVVSLGPEADEDAFGEIEAAWRDAPLRPLACNVFLPRDLKVVGPDVDWARVEHYVTSAMARVDRIGGRLVVFGSGGSRSMPDGTSLSIATAQLVDFLRLAADAAEPYGITIAIEPLNRKESNILNSVPEAVALAEVVARSPVCVLADLYHMQEEDEPLANVAGAGSRLAHVHVADSGRLSPGSGDHPFQQFAAQIATTGYAEGEWACVSVECRWQDFAREAPGAVEFLRTIWPRD